jgi:phage tail tape-measure protein
MAESIEFQLKLIDQMTGALRSGAESAQKLEQSLAKVVEKLEKTEKEEKKEKEEEEGMFTRAVEKGELFKDLIEKIADKVYELGERLIESTVEITDFGYRAEVALRHLNGETEGSAEKTEKMLAEAKQFALDAALPVDKVTESFLGLKRAGLSDEWVRPLTAAAGDIAALGGHPERFNELADAFQNMALKGEITGRDLIRLTNAGLSPAALAARLGAKDFIDLQKQLKDKPLGLYEGLRAIEDVVLKTAHEKTLGDVLQEDASTFGAQFTRIHDVWDILVDNLNNSEVFKGLRTDFKSLVDDLIKNLPKIEEEFIQIFDPILKALDDIITHPEAIKELFEQAIGVAKELIGVAAPLIGHVATHPGELAVGAAAAGGSAIGGLPGAVLAGGTVAYGEARSENVSELERVGYSEREALHLTGKFAEGGPVGETGPALVHEGEYVIPVGGAPVLRGGGGGGSVHAPITINVGPIHGAEGITEQGLSLKLAELLPGALVAPLEKLSATVGAT